MEAFDLSEGKIYHDKVDDIFYFNCRMLALPYHSLYVIRYN